MLRKFAFVTITLAFALLSAVSSVPVHAQVGLGGGIYGPPRTLTNETLVSPTVTDKVSITGGGNAIILTGATTGASYINSTNTGGDFYFGIESSAGGGIFTGSSAYANVFGSAAHNTPLQIAVNNSIVATFNATGLLIPGVLNSTRANSFTYSAASSGTFNVPAKIVNTTAGAGKNVLMEFGGAGNVDGFFGTVENASGFADFLWNSYNGAFAERMRLTSSNNLSVGGYSVPVVLCQSAVAVSAPADTNEDTLYTCTVPAGAMGANGSIRVDLSFTSTNSANNKTIRVRFGGISGTVVASRIVSTNSNGHGMVIVSNRSAANSQISSNQAGLLTVPYGENTAALITSTIDTASAVTVLATCQKATAGETCTLERVMVELMYAP